MDALFKLTSVCFSIIKTQDQISKTNQQLFLFLLTHLHWWCNLVFIFVNANYFLLTNNISNLDNRHTRVLNFFDRRKLPAYLCTFNGRNIKLNFAIFDTYWQPLEEKISLHKFISNPRQSINYDIIVAFILFNNQIVFLQ